MNPSTKGTQKKATTKKKTVKEDETPSNEETVETSSGQAAEVTSEGNNVDKMITMLEGMTMLEIDDLVKKIEEKFDVSAVMPMAVAAGPGAASAAQGPAEEEQVEFDVILTTTGDKKIQVIKVVRAITGLGLKEAKDLVDAAPKAVKEKINKNEAEEVRGKLEEVGAIVEIK